MKRREMLRASFRELAQALPLALGAAGSLGRLLHAGAGMVRPQAASFPRGNMEVVSKSGFSKEEEE